jgi:hypothetical protein
MRFGFGWKLLAFALLLRCIGYAEVSAQAAQAEASPAPAQSSLRVAVLRTTQGEAGELADRVDGALLRDLSSLAGIDNPTVSPIDYAEIQLTVGCSDEGRQCLSAIAQMVQVDAVVVRHLVVEPSRVSVTLTHFDATASDEPAHAEQVSEGADAGKAAVDSVPSLVRRLFGIPEPITAAAAANPTPGAGQTAGASGATAATPSDEGAKIGVLTWITLAAGSGLLASGLVVGANAQSNFDDFKKSTIKTESDAMRANSKFDSVKSQALVANILIPSGAAVMALAAALFVLDLTHGERSGEVAKLGVLPVRGGAMLTLHAVAGGM